MDFNTCLPQQAISTVVVAIGGVHVYIYIRTCTNVALHVALHVHVSTVGCYNLGVWLYTIYISLGLCTVSRVYM